MANKRACVIVLGDVGRSPRMQYHALSLAKEGFDVDIVGYGGSSPHSDLLFSSKISLHFMWQSPSFITILPRFFSYLFKVLWQTWFLTWTLLWISKPDFFLVQNPPSVPTLPVCWFVAKVRRVQLIVDWHNYGYTILGLTLGPNHTLVRVSKFLEAFFGRRANNSFCVTKAMKQDLQKNWGICATTLYDRPPEIFRPISLPDKHELFLKLAKDYHEFSSSRPDDTLLTERFSDGQVRLREDRPGLLVSSTSWTEDEDFSILLDALDEYELNRSVNSSDYPPLVCVITGKGPKKNHFSRIIQDKLWQHVEVCTPWLEAEDYPKLLASADLGVSLHTSSSGLDLPMKVVDMFGCGLPVCAVGYSCLNELITAGENGMIFKTAGDLADQLLSWFRGFPRENGAHRQHFRGQLTVYQNLRWHEEWSKVALPVMSSI